MKYNIDFEGLRKYLETKTSKDFQRMDKRFTEAEIKQGTAMDDIEFFKMDKSKITLDKVIFYGMPYLVDSVGNDLSIVQLTRRKYKNPKGRLVRSKFIQTIISDCRKMYGTCLNGYWMIPPQFLSEA